MFLSCTRATHGRRDPFAFARGKFAKKRKWINSCDWYYDAFWQITKYNVSISMHAECRNSVDDPANTHVLTSLLSHANIYLVREYVSFEHIHILYIFAFTASNDVFIFTNSARILRWLIWCAPVDCAADVLLTESFLLLFFNFGQYLLRFEMHEGVEERVSETPSGFHRLVQVCSGEVVCVCVLVCVTKKFCFQTCLVACHVFHSFSKTKDHKS